MSKGRNTQDRLRARSPLLKKEGEVIESDGRIDPEKLEVWMTRNLVDPKDPDNVELMQRVTEANIRQAR